MNIEEAFPSKYIKASDLKGQQVTVKMERIEHETIGDDNKVVLYFQGKEKGLVLNVTNKNMIVDTYGPETDEWIAQPVILYEAMVQYQSKMVPAIRIKAPPRAMQRPAKPAKQSQSDPRDDSDMDDDNPRKTSAPVRPRQSADMDDEIPFAPEMRG